MKVLILGSGVIGVATAYYMAKNGFDVTVVDREPTAALETSFANAGQISPGYSAPWAAPGIPTKALKWLFQKHAPLAIKPDGSRWQLAWMVQMLKNCNAAAYEVNKERMVRLAEYSRDSLRILRAETGISYDNRSQGTLQVFRTPQQLEMAKKDMEVLAACNVPFEYLDAAGCVEHEPALAKVQHELLGGLRLPDDETGDCFMFTQKLEAMAKDLGVHFQYHTHIERLLVDNGQVKGVEVTTTEGSETLTADHYVVALGSYSRDFLYSFGVQLPVYPVKGYSLTVPITNSEAAPVSTVMDETYKVAITRFDNRMRVGGMAELVGYDLTLNPRRRETLEMVATGLFPDAGDVKRADFWTGLRPMTPDGTPIIGPAFVDEKQPNLWINTGHGTLGWTMSCGSGKLLASILANQTTEIVSDDYSLSRYMPGHHQFGYAA